VRLLVRSNSHRPLAGGGEELASSPDTAEREAWQWDLRLDDPDGHRAPGADTRDVPLDRGAHGVSRLALSVDGSRVVGGLDVYDFTENTVVTRDQSELVVLVVGRGKVRIEGRHHLGPLDVMVLEGDDPISVDVQAAVAGPVSLAVARIDYTDGSRVAWVP
jgi:hypothetical protein